MLEQISQSIQATAAAWWEIEWASQQSQWDNLVMLSNTVVLQISQILPRCVWGAALRNRQSAVHQHHLQLHAHPQHACLSARCLQPS
jgi:hypothetical protein